MPYTQSSWFQRVPSEAYIDNDYKVRSKLKLSKYWSLKIASEMSQCSHNIISMLRESDSTLIRRLFPPSQVSKVSRYECSRVQLKLAEQIAKGFIAIAELSQQADSCINHATKEEALKKIFLSDHYYDYERDQRLMLNLPEPPKERKRKPRKKMVEEELQMSRKKSEEELKKQFVQKLREWEQQKAKLSKRRKQAEAKKQLLSRSSQEKRKRDEQQIEQFLKLEKRKVIEGRIKDIEDRRAKRHEFLQDSSVRHSSSVPKYIEYQNRFKNEELKKSLQREILIKNRRRSLEIDLEQIKQHERAYIQRIKDRLHIGSQRELSKSIPQHQKDFNLIKKDESQLKKLEEKVRRVKKFQSKVRLLPLSVDKQKERQMLILNDKHRNPQKYNFLSQKALSDQQIFENFPQFGINVDLKQVGNHYLEEVRKQNRNRPKKVNSESLLNRPKADYKNYIEELRLQRKAQGRRSDQLDLIVRKAKKGGMKEESREMLQLRSEVFEKKALSNIQQLKNISGYVDSVKKEEEIDDNFTKALRAKLALAKLS